MAATAPFSTPLFEIVSAAFGRALGELATVLGAEGEVDAALEHARRTARETMEALAATQKGDSDVRVLL